MIGQSEDPSGGSILSGGGGSGSQGRGELDLYWVGG